MVIPCHFLTANTTELQLTFALYFLYLSEMNLIKLWFYSYLLFVLKDTDCVFYLLNGKYNPRASLFHGPSLTTRSSYTGFTHYSLVSSLINSETFASPLLHPRCTRLQWLQPITKVFTCLGHLSASPIILLKSAGKKIPHDLKKQRHFYTMCEKKDILSFCHEIHSNPKKNST